MKQQTRRLDKLDLRWGEEVDVEVEEEAAALWLSCNARDQVNLTATPLTQDSVNDISRVCTIFERGEGGVGGKATHPPMSTYILLRKLFPTRWVTTMIHTIKCNYLASCCGVFFGFKGLSVTSTKQHHASKLSYHPDPIYVSKGWRVVISTMFWLHSD